MHGGSWAPHHAIEETEYCSFMRMRGRMSGDIVARPRFSETSDTRREGSFGYTSISRFGRMCSAAHDWFLGVVARLEDFDTHMHTLQTAALAATGTT